MKVFLVFLALLFINLNFFVYSSDLQRYEKIEMRMKAAAEDCAAGSALYYEEETYGEGHFQIDKKRAEDYMYMQLAEAEQDLKQYVRGKLTGCIEVGERETMVTVIYQGEDLFRLPFLEKTNLKRVAKYKWEE